MTNEGILKGCNVGRDYLRLLTNENETVYFKSNFSFLSGHNGLRIGKMHVMIGTSGNGKSTVARAIIHENMKHNKIMLWMSEENRDDFLLAMAPLNIPDEDMENVIVFSELDLPEECFSNIAKYRKYIESIIAINNPDLVIFDNLTTSVIYHEMQPGQQSKHANWLKSLCYDSRGKGRFPLFVIAHTANKVFDNQQYMIDVSDIRGSKTIANLSEYFYVYTKMKVEDGIDFPFIRIRKSRGHSHEGCYYLNYNPSTRSYTDDKKVPHSRIKEAFNVRDKL